MAGKNKLLSTVISIAGSIDPSLAKASSAVAKELDGINLKAKAIQAASLAIGGAIVGATIKGIKALDGLNQEFVSSELSISKMTGATGERLEHLNNIALTVYQDGMGESIEQVSSSLAKVNQISGLMGDELEQATKDGLLVSDAFGYDIAESTRSATALMKNFGMTADEAYGYIASGAQYGADKNGDMLDVLNEYSSHYASIGLSSDQMMASLLTGAEQGLFSIDKIGDAVKEFGIRSKDGSESTSEAFAALGLDAGQMSKAFAQGGEAAESAFFDTINALNDLSDPLKKNELGVALLGSQFEDIGSDILPVLASVQDVAIDSENAINSLEDLQNQNPGMALEKLKRSAKVALLPLAGTVSQSINDMIPVLERGMEGIIPVISEVSETLSPLLVGLFDGVAPVLEELLPIVIELGGTFLEKLMPPVLTIIKKVMPVLMRLVTALMPIIETLIELIDPIFDIITAMLDPILDIIDSGLTPLISTISLVIDSLKPLIDFITTYVIPVFAEGFKGAIEGLQPFFDSLIAIFESIIDFLSNVFTGNWEGALQGIQDIFLNIFVALGEFAKIPLNFIIGGVNGIIGGLNKLKIPDWVPVIGGKGFDIPEIPTFSSGGFTSGVSIAGEAGTEAVISFDPKYRKDNITYWEMAGQMLGVESNYLGENIETKTFVDSRQFNINYTPQIYPIKDETPAIELLRKDKEEFFDLLDEYKNKDGDTGYEPDPLY